jgi:hypothetical protein
MPTARNASDWLCGSARRFRPIQLSADRSGRAVAAQRVWHWAECEGLWRRTGGGEFARAPLSTKSPPAAGSMAGASERRGRSRTHVLRRRLAVPRSAQDEGRAFTRRRGRRLHMCHLCARTCKAAVRRDATRRDADHGLFVRSPGAIGSAPRRSGERISVRLHGREGSTHRWHSAHVRHTYHRRYH